MGLSCSDEQESCTIYSFLLFIMSPKRHKDQYHPDLAGKKKAEGCTPIYNASFIQKLRVEMDGKQADSTHMAINVVEADTQHGNCTLTELF